MAHVNLLPWREMAEQRAKKTFGIHAFIAVLIALLLAAVAHFIIDDWKQQQQTRNQYLSSQIKIVDGKIAEIQRINKKKAEILNRMKLIQSLHEDRNTAVHILNELAARTPDGIALLSVDKRDATLVITGDTVSNNRVAEFLRKLKESPIFAEPELRTVVADKGAERNERMSVFTLSVNIVAETTAEEGQP